MWKLCEHFELLFTHVFHAVSTLLLIWLNINWYDNDCSLKDDPLLLPFQNFTVVHYTNHKNVPKTAYITSQNCQIKRMGAKRNCFLTESTLYVNWSPDDWVSASHYTNIQSLYYIEVFVSYFAGGKKYEKSHKHEYNDVQSSSGCNKNLAEGIERRRRWENG